MKKYFVAFCALALLAGCGGSAADDSVGPLVGPKTAVSLKPFASCDDMKTHILVDFEQKIERFNKERCKTVYNGPVDGWIADQPMAGSAEDGATNFTDTNVQEKGVDEPDLVKTDGEYLYSVVADGVAIFRVWPFTSFAKIASVQINADPTSLYLIDDLLLVLSSKLDEKYSVLATFIDVSNPSMPEIVRESTYDGGLISSRAVGNMAHLVIQSYMSSMPHFDYYVPYEALPECDTVENNMDHKPYVDAINKLKQDNLEKINAWDVSSSLINVKHEYAANPSQDDSFVINCRDIMKSDAVTGDIFTTVISVNVERVTADDKIASILGDGGIVYGSEESIYVSAHRNLWSMSSLDSSDGIAETVIHRFRLGNNQDDTVYFGSTTVQGHILNQFSMSEYQGYLRIATTSMNWFTTTGNGVYTVDIEDPALPVVGKVEDLAPGESIYAVRFIGPRGFVVTFQRIDPLYTIDLADPLNPEVKGELKVPGFSTYLHPFSEDKLIGIGFDVDNSFGFTEQQGLQLSIFDVSNETNPTRLHNTIIGSSGTASEATIDHHAFTFDPTRSLMAIPVSLVSDNSYCLSAGFHVYKVTVNGGFELVNEIKRNDLGCQSSWWTSTSQAKRSIILGDGVSEGLIIIWKDRIDLYNLNNQSLLGSENVELPFNNTYVW